MTTLRGPRIRHLVVFTLRHDEGSPEAEVFLEALRSLAAIDGVEDFEVARQVGLKNDYRFAVSMEFASRAAYDAYDGHPLHVAFVRDRWAADVADFMEIDLSELRPG
ncbi:MAG: Dabb family protein [Nocardioides sp.]|nr:Dabb family protein [Nocardioides sp.]